jgi:hypothetical protein
VFFAGFIASLLHGDEAFETAVYKMLVAKGAGFGQDGICWRAEEFSQLAQQLQAGPAVDCFKAVSMNDHGPVVAGVSGFAAAVTVAEGSPLHTTLSSTAYSLQGSVLCFWQSAST